MRLRLKGISHISDVRTSTIEINGEIGYELKKHAQPLTIGDIEKLAVLWNLATTQPINQESMPEFANLFVEPDRNHIPEPQLPPRQ
jgi:uncharacterized membrane protein YcaP (DUF421 family)